MKKCNNDFTNENSLGKTGAGKIGAFIPIFLSKPRE
jgi:hypothetical protein